MVKLPSAFRITGYAPVPLTSWAAAGSEALASELRMRIEWVTEGTTAQEASHALTVRRKGIPAVWGLGAPVLPEGVPGAAVSPGSRTCSCENGPAKASPAMSGAARTRASHTPARVRRCPCRTTRLLECPSFDGLKDSHSLPAAGVASSAPLTTSPRRLGG